MNQYLDEKDKKWHISFSVDIPRVLIKNKLNFRLHSVVMKNGDVVRDPSLSSSNYIFSIAPSFMGKKVFFFSYFDTDVIEEVSDFKFGLCDERVRWYENTIISIKNEYLKNEALEIIPEIKVSLSEQTTTKISEVETTNKTQFEFETAIPGLIHFESESNLDSIEKVEIQDEKPLDIVRVETTKKISAKKSGRKKK